MHDVHFNALDLNLLRVLDALVEERSATRAGERLGLSQSAVSHALNRLRHALKDELFVRSSDGLEPTPQGGSDRGPSQAGPVAAAARRDGHGIHAGDDGSPVRDRLQRLCVRCDRTRADGAGCAILHRWPTCAWCRTRSERRTRSSPAGSTSRSARSATSLTASRRRICFRNRWSGCSASTIPRRAHR